MNYLAHAWSPRDVDALGDPYFVAGLATPDWLGLTRPRLRCRSKHARPYLDAADPTTASVSRGVSRHHADDDWFHQTPAFGDLSVELSRRVRAATGDRDGMRPHFLGHILVELLLDAAIIADRPESVLRYYDVLAEVDSARVAAAIGEMTDADASQVAPIIDKFRELRFLEDYVDDRRLLFRLNQVMRRVGLPELPTAFVDMLPDARELVAQHEHGLLAAPLAPLAA